MRIQMRKTDDGSTSYWTESSLDEAMAEKVRKADMWDRWDSTFQAWVNEKDATVKATLKDKLDFIELILKS